MSTKDIAHSEIFFSHDSSARSQNKSRATVYLECDEGSNLSALTKAKLAFLSVSHENRTGSDKSKIASD